MRAGANPDVRRMVEREKENIQRITEPFRKGFKTSRECIGALLAVLSLRQRYFALVGEHFSVFDFDGITAMDQLDEAVLLGAQEVLKGRPEYAGDEEAEKELAEAFANIPPIPQHPVGYMVLFQVRRIFEGFDVFIQEGDSPEDEKRVERHEHAFLKRVALLVDAFATARKTPITRHFGDMAREYSVVSRLHCRCGQPKYEVKMQSLITEKSGEHLDRLDVKCGACGDTQALEFPLPFFNDLSIA
ncbi:MAG: hypothetical protein HYY18_08995 [Planctomycetes bacterium]|nr:hypothetical protein [Planctomycetota bacterium]